MRSPYQIAQHSQALYIDSFGQLYENSVWVVKRCFWEVYASDKYESIIDFHHLLCQTIMQADNECKMKLILAHPPLAGKKAQKGELSSYSSNEQYLAGLTNCSEEELSYIQYLNDYYYKKNSFDFIMAVRNKTKKEIIEAFEQRLPNDREVEIQIALEQINQIAWLRLQMLYASP